MKQKTKLNITGYPYNAAKNFSMTKLAIITVISLSLTIALIFALKKETGTGKLFDLIVLAMIVGYDILNVMAILKKIKK